MMTCFKSKGLQTHPVKALSEKMIWRRIISSLIFNGVEIMSRLLVLLIAISTSTFLNAQGLWDQKTCMIMSASGTSVNDLRSRIIQSTGDKSIDDAIVYEYKLLQEATGIFTSLALYDDYDSPNALAIDAKLFGGNNTTVLLGRRLINESLSYSAVKDENGNHVGMATSFAQVTAIMMHEWAHLAQFRYGVHGPTVNKELMADILAGWYMGQRIYQQHPGPIQRAAAQLYSIGDYNFHDSNHHGTPSQREQAYWFGLNLYTDGVTNFTKAFKIAQLKMSI